MTDYSHKSLADSVGRLLEQVAALTENTNPDPDIKKLEQLARVVSLQLKTIDELQIHARREQARLEAETYTKFEDLRRPPPAERARMTRLLNRHFGITEERFDDNETPAV